MRIVFFFTLVCAVTLHAQDGAETCVPADSSSVTRFSEGIRQLASLDKAGRAPGSDGAELTVNFMIDKLDELHVRPDGDDGDWRQRFPLPRPVEVNEAATSLTFGNFNPKLGKALFATEHSNNGEVAMRTRFVKHGIEAPKNDYNDYSWRKRRLKRRIAVIDLSYPEAPNPYTPLAEHIDVRDCVQRAVDYGAKGVILINPSLMGPEPAKEYDLIDTVGVPVMFLRNPKMTKKIKRWWGKKVTLRVQQNERTIEGENIVGFVDNAAPYTVILSANYDGLGRGNRASNAPGSNDIHPGADHNASGVLMVLEMLRKLQSDPAYKVFNYQVVFFTGTYPERYGAKHFAEKIINGAEREYAYHINFDAVGRMGDGQNLYIEGTGSSTFLQLFHKDLMCSGLQAEVTPSNSKGWVHTDLYAAKVPGIRVTTGLHRDSYKPSDDAGRIQVNGMMNIAALMQTYLKYMPDDVHVEFDETFEGVPQRSSDHLRINPGIVPDYDYRDGGLKVQMTKPDSPAFVAGLHAGDIITHIDGYALKDIYHYMDYITFLKPDTRVVFKYTRNGKPGNAIIDL